MIAAPWLSTTELRRRAEDKLEALPDYKPNAMAEGDVLKLLHELEVHQIELEMQKQALIEAQLEISRNLEQITELYELAPVGYLTLDSRGCIVKANTMGRKLLGNPLMALDCCRLSHFVGLNCLDNYKDFLERIFTQGRLEQCRLTLEHSAGHLSSQVTLEGIADEAGKECRLVITPWVAAQPEA